LPNVVITQLQKGEIVRGNTTSGGGYGDPLERDPKRVLKDLLDGFETTERASDVYGVVVVGDIGSETLSVDVAATADRRRKLTGAR
jgi:N-methylhydantoinase B